MAEVVTVQAGPRSIQINTGLFINNEFVPSASGKKFGVFNPSDGSKIVDIFEAGPADVDLAVAAAKAAFQKWRAVPTRVRSGWIWKIVEELEKHKEDLAYLESLDNGKPVKIALAVDIPMVIETFRFYASLADKLEGVTYDTEPNDMSFTRREPIGVCGAIIPWNFPLLMLSWKTGPALSCGNTQVLKSSEKTPLTALYFAQLLKNIDFPAGVFNLLSGFGPDVGAPLAAHKDVRKIAFTGSVPTARRIMTLAAESNLKKISLELGGKSPNIIFDDADLDLAVASAVSGIYFNHGQTCCAGSRIFVQEGIYDEFVKRFVEAASKIRLGDQFSLETDQGPQVDDLQFNRILGYVDAGKQEGATVACGGHRVGTQGYFIAPTLLTDCHDNYKVVREEIFGPVAVALKFKTEEEAIERANNSEYGLAAAVFTTNLSRAFRVEKALEAGSVWVNCYNKFDVRIPFGGYKESGFGREMSSYALDLYTQIKAVRITL